MQFIRHLNILKLKRLPYYFVHFCAMFDCKKRRGKDCQRLKTGSFLTVINHIGYRHVKLAPHYFYCFCSSKHQCFDGVGWVAGRASGL